MAIRYQHTYNEWLSRKGKREKDKKIYLNKNGLISSNYVKDNNSTFARNANKLFWKQLFICNCSWIKLIANLSSENHGSHKTSV